MAATTAIKEQIRETLVRRHASRGVTARIFVADAETAEFSCEHVVASDVACSMAQQRFQKGAEHTGSSDKFGRSEGGSGHDGKYQGFIWTASGVTCADGNLLGSGLGWSIKRSHPVAHAGRHHGCSSGLMFNFASHQNLIARGDAVLRHVFPCS